MASGTWDDPLTSIEWTVDNETAVTPGHWHYEYTLSVSGPGDISHTIIEASLGAGFSENDVLNASSDPGNWIQEIEVKTYEPGGSNPYMPGDLFGIKFDADFNVTTVTILFDSRFEPVWGDFYAKDGHAGGGDWATVWNAGFLNPDPDDGAESTGVDDHILRPDSKGDTPPPIPEPALATALSILAGSGIAIRRFRGK